jgi:hypothetical protein
MLERSKMAPLIVNAKLCNDPSGIFFAMDTAHLTLQHISRIKELRLVTSNYNIEVQSIVLTIVPLNTYYRQKKN